MKNDRHHIIKWISHGFLVLGALIGAVSLINTFSLAQSLPDGVCPYTDTRPWMYLAIAFCLVSLVLSFFEGPNNPKK